MPDDAGAFARAVAARGVRRFKQIEHLRTTASTNADAMERLGDPASAGLVIVADEQSEGAGRRGRRWIAPARSGLLFTAVLPGSVASAAAWAVPLWTGLAVAAALERNHGVRATLQWPNDLLVDGRKLCGILCVSRINGERATVACGVGLNVFRPADDAPLREIVPPPLFLDDVAALRDGARPKLLAEILHAFEHDLAALRDPGGVARSWEARAGLPGVPYRFAIEGEGEIDGLALRIAPGGALVVQTAGGERTIELAEARVVR